MELNIEEVKADLLERQILIQKRVEKLSNDKKMKNGALSADSKEQAVELQNHEVIDALDEIEIAELKQISKALIAIESGTYGQCKSCTEPIATSRLKALPFAEFCIGCASEK